MDRKKVSICLSVIGGVIDIFFGLPSLYGFGFLAWSTSRSFQIIMGIMLLIPAILAIVSALVEVKSLIIGSLLCFIAAILNIVLPIIGSYYYYHRFEYSAISISYFPTIFIIVGGILGILEWRRGKMYYSNIRTYLS